MELLVWMELLVGFLGVFFMLSLFKIYQLFRFWRNSFYTEIYSSFIEFLFRRKSLNRMSTSYWLSNELGDHRIMYQMAHSQDKNLPQAYIIIALSSGIYILQIKNYKGKVEGYSNHRFQLKISKSVTEKGKQKADVITIANPFKEIHDFTYRWNKLIAIDSPIYNIIVFSDQCQVEINPLLTKNIIVINRKEMFRTIKDLHNNNTTKNLINVNDVYTKFMTVF